MTDWGFLAAAALAATPLWLAALGETVAERGGVINLGLEGIMLLAATAGFAVTAGMPLCPSPTCVLYPYDRLATLDDIGRGLCPPCYAAFEAAAAATNLVKKFE